MTNYTATVSSKGQITIPIEARRKLGLHDKVSIDLEDNKLTIKQPPTMEDVWAILDAPASGKGLSKREEHDAWARAAIEKDKRKRGY